MNALMTGVLSIGFALSSMAIAQAEESPTGDASTAQSLTTESAETTSSQFLLPEVDFAEVAESLEIIRETEAVILSDLDNRPEESNSIEVVF
ncbi:MAG: hypothetical protein AAGA75_18920 [Cyanobacteria bacterium P01_E01_bin.6]